MIETKEWIEEDAIMEEDPKQLVIYKKRMVLSMISNQKALEHFQIFKYFLLALVVTESYKNIENGQNLPQLALYTILNIVLLTS